MDMESSSPQVIEAVASSQATSQRSESYQETDRYCTWRKHCLNLYQRLVHIDLVWESPVAQYMPYVTVKDETATHTILSGTRTGGQEQSYLQLLSVCMPRSAAPLDTADGAYNEVSGEVGGYGMAGHHCGVKVERRILHSGDVLTARYMPANPLLIASASSDENVYVFDWSRVSLNKFPNDPPRPRAPLPPNELSSNPTDEERIQYQKRMRALNAVVTEQDRWDRRTGDPQHVLQLVGGCGPSDNLDWNTKEEGLLVSGSTGRACVWQIGDMGKDDPRVVQPRRTVTFDDEQARITSVSFSWTDSNAFLCASSSGTVYFNDVRADGATEVFTLPAAPTAVSISPLDGNSVLVGDADGDVHTFDLRHSAHSVHVAKLHTDEVTSVQWCPHSRHLFASAGRDACACIYSLPRETMLFRHAGHTDIVMDLGWCWQEDSAGQLISADCNSIMLWRPRDCFYVL